MPHEGGHVTRVHGHVDHGRELRGYEQHARHVAQGRHKDGGEKALVRQHQREQQSRRGALAVVTLPFAH